MASLAVASSINVAASASSLVGARVTGSSSNASVSVKMAPIRCQAKAEAEVVQRRAVVAGAAAAFLSLLSSGSVKAEEEPKDGSPEAKKKYANICVSMPTAKVCHG